MNHRSRCYLCLAKINQNHINLCLDCFCLAQESRLSSCSRCGKKSCVGCNHLSLFQNVFSLYSYDKIFSYVLDLAKNKSNANVQELFFHLFFVSLKKFLIRILNEKKYDYIILSPLRRERVFLGSWHPNLFYESVFKKIMEDDCVHQHIKLISPHFIFNKKKQAILSAQKRFQIEPHVKKNQIYIPKLTLYDETINNQSVLLMDDVLTTGKTAILSKEMCESSFQNCSWDLLSLFRTSQKGFSSR